MRGEDVHAIKGYDVKKGSPPHARGRHHPVRQRRDAAGITPACAGKTSGVGVWLCGARDHPRMRGEDAGDGDGGCHLVGSPPHARGRRKPAEYRQKMTRITPACAGKTPHGPAAVTPAQDHPRMRGEDTDVFQFCGPQAGSPPHARGRLSEISSREALILDHPRMRGEDEFCLVA